MPPIHAKITQQNIGDILGAVVKKFTSIKRVAYFEDLSSCLNSPLMTSFMFSASLSGEELQTKLKKSNFSKKFEWLGKSEPKSGILLYFLVSSDKPIIINLTKLNLKSSEIRIFLKYKNDFEFLPHQTLDFIEKLISIHKAKHMRIPAFGASEIIFLHQDEKQRSNLTRLQLSVYSLIVFLSDRKQPMSYCQDDYLPCLNRAEYWNFCKEVNLIMTETKSNETAANGCSSTSSPKARSLKSELTSCIACKAAHLENRKLREENFYLKAKIKKLSSSYNPY